MENEMMMETVDFENDNIEISDNASSSGLNGSNAAVIAAMAVGGYLIGKGVEKVIVPNVKKGCNWLGSKFAGFKKKGKGDDVVEGQAEEIE